MPKETPAAVESRMDYEARLTREQAAANLAADDYYTRAIAAAETEIPRRGNRPETRTTKATAARQNAAAKRKAAERALREQKAAEDKANAGQPSAGQLAVIAEREQKKAATEAVIALKSAFLESLEPFAKEINHRFEQAQTLDGKADDHRLAASLKLAEARALCEANHVRFKDWAEQNVKEHNYDYVLRLAKVGAADDPKLALEDMRKANAETNRNHRAKKKQIHRSALAQANERSEVVGGGDPQQALVDQAQALDMGYGKPAPKQATGIDALKHAFGTLKAAEQMAFVTWAAEEVGAVLDFDLDDAAEHGSATAEAQFLNQQSA